MENWAGVKKLNLRFEFRARFSVANHLCWHPECSQTTQLRRVGNNSVQALQSVFYAFYAIRYLYNQIAVVMASSITSHCNIVKLGSLSSIRLVSSALPEIYSEGGLCSMVWELCRRPLEGLGAEPQHSKKIFCKNNFRLILIKIKAFQTWHQGELCLHRN